MVKGLSSELKWRRKKWYTVLSPAVFKQVELGQIPTTEPEKLIGKVVNISASSLLNDPRKRTKRLKFKIIETKGSVGHSTVLEYSIPNSQIKRIIRKNGNRIDLIGEVKTKEGKTLNVQTVFITNQKVQKIIRKKIRETGEKMIKEQFSKLMSDEVFEKIISNDFQKSVKSEFRKYHVKIFEVLKCRIV